MASKKKKQKGMVLHREGAFAPAAAPAAERLPACTDAARPGRASEGGIAQDSRRTGEEANKRNVCRSPEALSRTGGLKHPTGSTPQSPNILSPDSVCKGVRVTLDNNSMWNEFFSCRTEMILTQQGSRMFPYCRFRISGLQPSRKYSLIMDIQLLDNNQYRWSGKSWQVAGKAESHIKRQPFAHPESPASGQHWMQNPVSFYRLKLTNNTSNQEGNMFLHPMHRYLPRLHVVLTDKAAKDIKLSSPSVITFTFPQTEFMAVTAYQNARFAQLKVHYNPFSKGLKEDGSGLWGSKLTANSSKELLNKGAASATEQHPVKQNLKSLLANHKPRSSKAPPPDDLQTKTTANKDQSAAKVLTESSCSVSQPPQKLFSELIREAHVSLHRCNLEEMGINHSTPVQTEQPNTKTSSVRGLRGRGKDVAQGDNLSAKAPTGKDETVVTKKKATEDDHLTNPLNCTDNVRIDCPIAAAPAESSDNHRNPDASSEATVKQHKRPARLPLPALALFLKQHSTKSKKSKTNSPPPALPSESESLPSDLNATATSPSKDLIGEATNLDVQATRRVGADLHPDEVVLNVTEQTVETAHRPSSPLSPGAAAAAATDPLEPRTNDHLSFISDPALDQTVPHGTPVLPGSDQPFCNLGAPTPALSSTLATSCASPTSCPPCDTVLPAPSSPQTPTNSSTLPSDSPSLKPESLLSYPECSSFSFEPLSPASSPELLPPLPASLTFDLDSSASEAAQTIGPPANLPRGKVSSVFKWHTVLPPPEPYVDTSFTTFQPTPQALSPMSVTLPLLPSQIPSHPETQRLNTSTSTPHPEPPPSFPENEQSLPFPAELSPLALQLPLSPTFSSLDGEGLSPTPSLADLVQFFSTDDDLGMEFSNTEAAAAPCLPPPPVVEAQEPSRQPEPVPVSKPCRGRKKIRRRKPTKTDVELMMDESTYRNMQPNLEEVEEQLFVSFTSKEALKLHIADSSEGPVPQPQTTAEDQRTTDTPENDPSMATDLSTHSADSLEEFIADFQKLLLRDLMLMKHRQVIHPVLQEVGLKMNLLDPTLAIDLQYLGVCLPIPPPGAGLEGMVQELPSSQGVSSAFVSRTGKTTDVTQIKGWRDKFSQSEAPPTLSSCTPEAGPSSSEQQKKKNLSAFCSDMLDEYLENEGKLIDERAASFSQPPVEPPAYELPTTSTSYVRTLEHVLKKQNAASPASDLISGFIPPSKRPRPPEAKTCRRKPRSPRPKPRPEPAAAVEPDPSLSEPAVQTATTTPPSASDAASYPGRKRRRFKPRTSFHTLSPSRTATPSSSLPEDLAPLESDSELGLDGVQSKDVRRRPGRPPMTRALLRQKDLEEAAMWEGRTRTGITEERATVALMSLFTLTGFVSEDPLAPIQLASRRRPRCRNDFCRLGCICSSLSYSCRMHHCGRPGCMFGCSCLKQKVVLLKNLDGSDCSPPSQHTNTRKRRRRRRRMKMAYILKEADSVSQPAERIRTLWRRDDGADPDPVHVPEESSWSCSTVRSCTVVRVNRSSCARVRAFRRKKREERVMRKVKQQRGQLKRKKNLKRSRTSSPPAGEAARPPSEPPASPPGEVTPTPSKRLFIVADCHWGNDSERSLVLKTLCEAMAQDRLDQPFWIRNYLISPSSQTVEGDGPERCICYEVHVSKPRVGPEKSAGARKPEARIQRKRKAAAQTEQDHLGQVSRGAVPPDHGEQEEAEPLEDWQREVEEDDMEEEEEEEEGRTGLQVHDGNERSEETMKVEMRGDVALPFLMGVSPAGFLSAKCKQPGGTDQLVQVNGKLYPLAKIQLGMMGALHPANRLAAYLTGRVGSSKQQRAAPSSSSCRSPQSSGLTTTSSTLTTSSATSLLSAHSAPTAPTAPTAPNSIPIIAAITTAPTTSTTFTTPQPPLTLRTSFTDSVVRPVTLFPGVAPPQRPQVLRIQVPRPWGTVPVSHVTPRLPAVTSTGQRILLEPVQMASGLQCYRKPDGKLIQLVLSQMRPVNPKPTFPRGSLTAPPVMTVTKQQTPSLTTITSSSSSSSSSLLVQTGTTTVKILPADSSRSSAVVTCLKPPPQPPSEGVTSPVSFTFVQPPPPPANLLMPSAGGGAEPRVNPVMTSVVPTGGVQQKPASTGSSPAETTDKPPPPPAAPEPASDPRDLDIECIDDEVEVVTTEVQRQQVVEVTSSSETDDSSGSQESDSEDEDDEEEEEQQPRVKNQRLNHKLLERKRRGHLKKLFDHLRRQVGLSDHKTPKIYTLKRAMQVIKELQRVEAELQEEKKKLKRRRDRQLSILAPPPGGAEPTQQPIEVSSDEEGLIIAETRETAQANERHGAARSDPQRTQQAPPTHTPFRPQRVPQASHNAPVPQERRRTIPNILSRSKSSTLQAKTANGIPASFQALVPAEVLSLVGTALPGKPILALSSLMGGATVLQATPNQGVASVTLNIPNLTNQQLHLSPALPCPQTAANINNLLQQQTQPPPPPSVLVSGGSEDQSSSRTNLRGPAGAIGGPIGISGGTARTMGAPLGTNGGPAGTTGAPLVSSGGPTGTTGAPLRTNEGPAGTTGAPLVSSGGLAEATGAPLGTSGGPTEITGAPLRSSKGPAGSRGDPNESLTSLVNELVFLNQQTVVTEMPAEALPSEDTTVVGEAEEQGHAHSPWLLQLDSDSESEEPVAMEKDSAGLNGHVPPGPANGNSKDGGLAPPPLQQMKVGGANMTDTSSGDRVAAEGGGGRKERGVVWRPMPRLVPLGLRGTPSGDR